MYIYYEYVKIHKNISLQPATNSKTFKGIKLHTHMHVNTKIYINTFIYMCKRKFYVYLQQMQVSVIQQIMQQAAKRVK